MEFTRKPTGNVVLTTFWSIMAYCGIKVPNYEATVWKRVSKRETTIDYILADNCASEDSEAIHSWTGCDI